MCFAQFTEDEAKTHLPDIVVMDEKNRIVVRRKGRETVA